MSIGRPKLILWSAENEFKLMKLENNKQAAGCLKCNKILKNTAMKRLVQHRNICKIANSNNDENYDDSLSQHDSSSDTESEEIKPNFVLPAGIKRKHSRVKIQQQPVFEPVILNDPLQPGVQEPQENEELDDAIAEFFFGCNIPFSVIESDHFKNFLHILKPGYEPMSKNTLSNVMLNKIHKKLDVIKYEDQDAILLIDSWKHSSNCNNVVSVIHFGKGKSQFLKAWELVGPRETGYLSEIIQESINMAKTRFSANIYAIVSDNPTSIVKIQSNMKIWHYRCVSYTAKLLVKDILPQSLAPKISKLIDYFESNEMHFVTSADNNWLTYRDTMESVLGHLPEMKKIVSSESDIRNDVKSIVLEGNFKKQLEHLIDIFGPIAQLMNVCESSESTVADAVHEWITLELPKELIEHTQLLDKLKRIATNKYGLAAYYLHPVYRGKGLKNEDLDTVEYFLLDLLDAAGLDELQSFKNNEGVFGRLNNKINISPETYWKFAERNNPNLSKLAKKLLKIPASIGQVDRLFSIWSFVHSTGRNKLPAENANKLTNAYYHLKLKDKNYSPDY